MTKGGDFLEYFAKYDSPLGPLLMSSDGENLTGLHMGKNMPAQLDALGVFDQTGRWLDDYFRGEIHSAEVPLKVCGTPFQKAVWERLLKIPPGELISYGQIAREMAEAFGKEKMSAQAVGQAVGKNPISILIPCHRVVGANRQLTGYSGGIEKKIWLLNHEGWHVCQGKCIK